MRIFAIDTALGACSAALLDTELGIVTAQETQPMQRGHAEALMPLIERVLEQARLDFSKIDRIAVTTGPGSFTGLRVGISAARGLALASGKPAVGLTTLAAYAAPLIAADDMVPVAAVVDARHGHVYLQLFGSGGRTLVTPRFASLAAALRAAATSGSPRIVGNAASLFATAWPTGDRAPILFEQRGAPDIGWVARLGAAAVDTGMPPKPLYLRAVDARPQLAAQPARR